jgi:hypothetical protein
LQRARAVASCFLRFGFACCHGTMATIRIKNSYRVLGVH